jgi:hypothetical protein
MATVKTVTGANSLYGPWDIYSNVVTIHGNINIIGNLANIASSLTAISNAYVIVNDAETGSGITGNAAGYGNAAGFIVDRGTLPNAFWHFHEVYGGFIGNITGNLSRIMAADPTANSHVVTLQFLSNTSAGVPAVGANTYVQYNQGGGLLLGNANFTWDNANLNVYRTQIGNAKITTTGTNQDLKLFGNGTGVIAIEKGLKFNFKNLTPTSVSSNTLLFANTVGSGNTGLYVVNSSRGDELVGKTRAIGFNIMI